VAPRAAVTRTLLEEQVIDGEAGGSARHRPPEQYPAHLTAEALRDSRGTIISSGLAYVITVKLESFRYRPIPDPRQA
jgi:hypothetical protein